MKPITKATLLEKKDQEAGQDFQDFCEHNCSGGNVHVTWEGSRVADCEDQWSILDCQGNKTDVF